MDNSSLYQSQLLSGLAQRFTNKTYIADSVLTPVTVPNINFQYHTWDDGIVYREQNTNYGPDGSFNSIDMKATKNSANVVDHALSAWVDERELNQAPEMAVKAVKTRMLINALQLKKERVIAGQLFSSSVMTNGTTLSGTDQWSHEDSDPKAKILTVQATAKVRFNTLVLGKQVWDKLQLHPLINEAVKYTQGAVDTRQVIAAYLQIDKVLVGEALYDTAAEGQTQSLGLVWGKHALLCYVAPGPSSPLMDEVSVGYNAQWGGGGNGGIRVFTPPANPARGTGAGAQMVKVEMSYKPIITSVACGYLFTNAVA